MTPSPTLKFILASASPRRRELLAAAGLLGEVDPVDVDERPEPGEAPARYVERVARLKAEAGSARHPARLVLAADTVVVVDDAMLGKPVDDEDAARMLLLLSGRVHRVLTGVAISRAGRTLVHVEATTVRVNPLSEEEIAWYVRTGEPRDKAGAYAIQGRAAAFVRHLAGSHSGVMGLPLHETAVLMRRFGVELGAASTLA